MKRLIIFVLTAVMAVNLMAQEVQETTANIGNLTVPAYSMTLQKDKKVVQDALEQRLKEAKIKLKRSEGYEASLGKVFTDIAPTPVNFYTKVEGNSNQATITVCAISTDLSASQSTINANVVTFMKNLAAYTEKREAQALLELSLSTLKKAEKEQKSANSDLAKLEKTTQKDRDEIASRQKDIEKYRKEIEKAEKEIKELNAKVEKNTGNKLDEARKRVDEANKMVETAKNDVEKYRQLAQ